MGRIRTIKPEFPQSESMGRVSREARLCFLLLFTVVDDSGRTRASSRMLASLLYPYDDDAGKRIDGWMSELEKESCIARYSSGGNQYLQILKWLHHQKIDKPSPSKIPPFDESSRVIDEHSDTPRAVSVSRNGSGEDHSSPARKAVERVFDYYLNALGKNKKTYELTDKRIQKGLLCYKECLKRFEGAEEAEAAMRQAVDGLTMNEWSMGKSAKSTRSFVDWEEYVFKSVEVMESRWQNYERGGRVYSIAN